MEIGKALIDAVDDLRAAREKLLNLMRQDSLHKDIISADYEHLLRASYGNELNSVTRECTFAILTERTMARLECGAR